METMTNTSDNTSQVKVKLLVARDRDAIEKLPKMCLFFEDGLNRVGESEEGKEVLRCSDLTSTSGIHISSNNNKMDSSMSMSMSEMSSDEGSMSRSSLGVRFNERVERVTYKSLVIRGVVKSDAEAKTIEMKEAHESVMRLAQAHAAMARASTSSSTSALPEVSIEWSADFDDYEESPVPTPSPAFSKASSCPELETEMVRRQNSGSANGLLKAEFYASRTNSKGSPSKPPSPFNLPSLLKFKKSPPVKA